MLFAHKTFTMRMIYAFSVRLLLACLVLQLSFSKASAQGFAWAQEIVSLGGNGNPVVTACTTDSNNDRYFIGMFNGTADFDPSLSVQNLNATGDLNMYILKKDAAGNFLWVKHIAGITANSSLCWGKGIALDNLGNIYVGGLFQDSFDFDPGPAVHQLSAHGGGHSFVLKLNPIGDFIWVKDMGNQTTVANMSMLCMKMDAAANIFFGCSIGGTAIPATIDVDPGTGVYNILCPPATGNDILIEKLDSAGNFVWAKQISGPDDKDPWALTLDTLSNVYISGHFKSTVDFDPGLGVANLSSTALYDAFIAKYDSSGNYLWAEQIGGSGNQVGYGIATDTFGGVVVTGAYEGFVDFDPGPGVYNVASNSMDVFVLKLRVDGSFGWVRSILSGTGVAVATDWQGNIYTTGEYFGLADFDPGANEYWLSGGAYVQKLDSAGNFAWAKTFGGEYPVAIALDHANDIYVLGWFNTAGDFDPGPDVFTLTGGTAGFIEKLCGSSLAITASDSTPCPGDNVQLFTPAITGATYTWTMNGNAIGGNSNVITVSQPGVYEVYVDGGCPSASGPLYIIDCTTGIGETTGAAGIKVYPNPTHDKLTIETILPNYTLTIINTLGQVVEQRAESKSVVLDVSQYNSGIYYLRIETTDGHALNRKFVVQH